nr:ribonuclease H-like domain-containing protein [Tanacetum cinerariifolium]
MSNTNNTMQTQTSNALHNAIMEAGGKDRPPMLAPGNYVQWKSIIKRYIETKPNYELIYYCLQNPPYEYTWNDKIVPVAEGSTETTIKRYMENYKNVSQDIRDQLNAEVEAVQIILTGIDNDIYSTVDACSNACEMLKAIERLKQGESINVQDLETNLYWKFGKFTSRDVLTQLQPEWQRFVTLVKQSQELKTVSYHKLYDILKQHQNEVNEIRAERLARTANPLALVAQQQSVYHPQNHPTHYTQNSSTKSQQAVTRNRGKAIVNSPPPIYDQEASVVAEDDEMLKDKEIDKLMALISLSFKKIYKPTNNNLQTSSNTSRAKQDNSPRINRGTGYYNQRIGNIAGARENVGTPVVQQSRIQCYNCKEYGHVARECQKLKWAKDAAYHKENMLLSHYMYMAQIQEVTPDAADNSGPIFDTEPLQKNFDTINLLAKNDIVIGLPKLKFVKDHLCSSCELGKAKRKSFQTKTIPSSKRRLHLLHMDLCGPMRVESINGKKYVLVIVDDYSRYTWTHFLRSKDETPEVLIDFFRLVQRGLHAQSCFDSREKKELLIQDDEALEENSGKSFSGKEVKDNCFKGAHVTEVADECSGKNLRLTDSTLKDLDTEDRCTCVRVLESANSQDNTNPTWARDQSRIREKDVPSHGPRKRK